MVFPPETETLDSYTYNNDEYTPKEARGATVFFNGWESGTGLFSDSVSNSTAYTRTYAYVENEQDAWMWIGFQNYSRSKTDRTPYQGTWDHRQSKVWLNNVLIDPPVWNNPGQAWGMEDPFDGQMLLWYRQPTLVHLNAGWNKILLKAPKSSGIKWMCTAVIGSWDGTHFRELDGVTYSPTDNFNWFQGQTLNAGDLNFDCCVNLQDMSRLAMGWLEISDPMVYGNGR